MRAFTLFTAPFTDLLHGLDRCLGRGLRSLAFVLLGTLAGWWVYVPVHELLHAAACAAAGGRVSRLEIDARYGGALLARAFPFVVAGGEYAGRLSGFDTRGSDWIYLATDLGPFVLTLSGIWAQRRAAAAGRPFLFGAALPYALAPFLSLTGDAYEIGAIVVTRLPPWTGSALRGDDLAQKIHEIARVTPPQTLLWGGLALATAAGAAWAFFTYAVAGALAHWIMQRSSTPERTL